MTCNDVHRLELAGLSPSAHLPANATDGDSIAATLLGKTQPGKAFVYHEYCGPSESKKGWGQALRVGNMSGVCLGADLSSGWPVCTTSTFLLYDDEQTPPTHFVLGWL